MGEELVRYEVRDAVAVLRLDDGKANALSHAALDALGAALDRAEQEAGAVALLGRPGCFSGGFDLAVMRGGGDAVGALVGAGAELAVRILEFPRPVAVGCTGHAVAMGALLLLAADARVGTEGSFRIVLNEVGAGMTLPIFGVELGRHRLSKRHVLRAALTSEIYDPAGAVDAGFLDRVVAPGALEEALLDEATRLGNLPGTAFAATKRRVNGGCAAAIRATLAADMESLTGLTP